MLRTVRKILRTKKKILRNPKSKDRYTYLRNQWISILSKTITSLTIFKTHHRIAIYLQRRFVQARETRGNDVSLSAPNLLSEGTAELP